MNKPPALSNQPQPFEYTWLQKLGDIVITIRGLWLLLLFNLLALFAFIGVAQGTDVLLSIVENSTVGLPWPMVWLLIALLFWSIVSEFCTRFIIYLTDNSGRSVAPQRVSFRKKVQKLLSKILLFYPTFLIIIALIKAWLSNQKDFYTKTININFALFITVLIGFAFILFLLYVNNGIVKLSKRYPRLAWLSISPREDQWVKKLYGIFNDVRVDIPDTTFGNSIDLPRQTPLPNGMILPAEFIPYNDNPQKDGNLCVWIFKIPLSFYSCLKRQLLVLFTLAAFFILLFSFLGTPQYMKFGAAALICLSFGCWQVVYVTMHFIDKIQRRIPVRLILFILFIVSSFYNQDHPVRTLGQLDKKPVPLVHHFNAWFNTLQADTNRTSSNVTVYRTGPNRDTVPVVFIAAEGGALRTGAFTAMTLSKLADNFPSLVKYIYCYSGVSGGTLGTNFFNALQVDHNLNGNQQSYSKQTEDFFKQDYLAAATGKLVFGEILNYFIPWHISRFDRAIALEQAWEYGWKKLNTKENRLEQSFSILQDNNMAAVFINTTEAESGLQCIWSNVGLDTITLGKQRDLYARTGLNLSYSTAINLSTRFPLVSPGAAITYFDQRFKKDSLQRKHFVDGGYFENTGAETLLEVLKLLHLESRPVKPYIIQFNFADKDTIRSSSIRKFSEPMEIIGAIYNTRSGRSGISQAYLERYTLDSLKGVYISLNLEVSTKKFPMNWILSATAMRRLNTALDSLVSPRIRYSQDSSDKNQLHRLFVYK